MRRYILAITFGLAMLAATAMGELTVQVSIEIDAEELEVGETTTVHVYGLVDEGIEGQDGLFSFCMDINFDVPDILEIVPGSIVHPGASNFDEPMSSLGQISADGLQDSYDMYFFDESHSIGIGSPQELLQFDILAVAEGICNMQAVADSTDGNHVSDGTVTGFVLFSGDDHLSVYEDPDRVVAGITTGACCLDASCSEQTPADCFDFGGSYLGDNVICDAGSCAPPCPSDINGDGVVSVADLLILIADWGPSSGDSDLDGDGDVDVADLLLLIAAWGDC